MFEDQFRGMQELPRDPPSELLRPRPLRATHATHPTNTVYGVPDHRMANVFQVHTNLVLSLIHI